MTAARGLLFVSALALPLRAASPAAWEMNSFEDFLKGRFEGVSLARDGRVTLAPKLETIFGSDQPMVWSVAQTSSGALYLGTGHRGRLYRIDPAGKSEVVFTAAEPEIFAVAVDAKDRVYAATSPNGKVYRIENGKASEWYSPGAGYIWSLAAARDGSIYVGTGAEGKVYRVDESGKGESVVRDRTVAHHQYGAGPAGAAAGRHRAERDSLSHRSEK